MKRLLDIVASSIGLLILWPLLLLIAVAVKVTSRGPVLFRQERVGHRGRPFFVLKFRSMVADAPRCGGQITFGDDPRITRFGHVLRITKCDELTQLINVFKGDMSFVGPRPEVPKYVDMFRSDYEEILQVRPGITDLASIRFRNEASLLMQAADPEYEYTHHVLPEKIRMAKDYVRRQSLWLDLWIILGTAFYVARDVFLGRRARLNAAGPARGSAPQPPLDNRVRR